MNLTKKMLKNQVKIKSLLNLSRRKSKDKKVNLGKVQNRVIHKTLMMVDRNKVILGKVEKGAVSQEDRMDLVEQNLVLEQAETLSGEWADAE